MFVPVLHCFLFLLLRRPPTSPLFPYTTLFRSLWTDCRASPPAAGGLSASQRLLPEPATIAARRHFPGEPVMVPRSEEHTSELQSLTNLVCRLLLEKKKKRHTLHVRSTTKTILI